MTEKVPKPTREIESPLFRAPAMPSTKMMGRNTATVVRVEAATAPPTSVVPATAAAVRSRPSVRLRWMDSRTTMALSTSMPAPSASAADAPRPARPRPARRAAQTNPAAANCQLLGVYAPELTEMFANALKLLTDDKLYAEFSAVGRRRVEENYTIQKVTAKYLNFYRSHLCG